MTEKKDYEVAVDDFVAADKAYKETQNKILSGDWIVEAGSRGGPEDTRAQWLILVEQSKVLLETRNAKLKTAQNALRQAVQLSATQWRGEDGEATKLSCGPFSVSSVTGRSFDAQSLLNLAREYGLYERVLELQAPTKEGGTHAAVRQEWIVDYEYVKNWLKANNLTNILDGSYDEEEKTPAVTGPKPLAFLGDEIKK
jgi:hypothetical protein